MTQSVCWFCRSSTLHQLNRCDSFLLLVNFDFFLLLCTQGTMVEINFLIERISFVLRYLSCGLIWRKKVRCNINLNHVWMQIQVIACVQLTLLVIQYAYVYGEWGREREREKKQGRFCSHTVHIDKLAYLSMLYWHPVDAVYYHLHLIGTMSKLFLQCVVDSFFRLNSVRASIGKFDCFVLRNIIFKCFILLLGHELGSNNK